MKRILETMSRIIDRVNGAVGSAAGWLAFILVLFTVYDVLMRYVFRAGSVAIQETEWHMYSANFLLAAGWTMLNQGHVRVDMIYQRLGPRKQAGIDLAGSLLFCVPYCILVIWASYPFVLDSWVLHEGSPDPGGLPAWYIIKTIMPLSYGLLGLQALSEAAKNLLMLIGHREHP